LDYKVIPEIAASLSMFQDFFDFISGNVPGGIFLLLMPLAIVLFVLGYLNRHAQIFSRAKFKVVATSISALLFCLYGAVWYFHRPPRDRVRIAVYPFLSLGAPFQDDWIGWAAAQGVQRTLQQHLGSGAIVYPLHWLTEALPPDSLVRASYQWALSKRIGADYYLSGQWRKVDGRIRLRFHFIKTGIEPPLLEESLEESPENLSLLAERIATDLLARLEGKPASRATSTPRPSLGCLKAYTEARRELAAGKLDEILHRGQRLQAEEPTCGLLLTLMSELHLKKELESTTPGEPTSEHLRAAKALLDSASRLQADEDAVQVLYGKYYVLLKKWGEAEKALRRAWRLNPWNPDIYVLMAQLHPSRYSDLGFKDEEALYRRALFIDPCHVEARMKLADYYFFNKLPHRAIDQCQALLRINPNSIDGLMMLGKIYISRNEVVKVVEVYTKVITLDPSNADAYYNLGIFYFNQEDYATATKLFQRAIALTNYPDAHLYLAYLAEKQGRFEEAIEHLRERIRLKKGPEDPYAESAREHLYQLLHPDTTTRQ